MDRWRPTASFRRVFYQAAKREAADDQSFEGALREVARGVEVLAYQGLPCPALPRKWVERMRERDWLTDVDDVPVQDEGDDRGER